MNSILQTIKQLIKTGYDCLSSKYYWIRYEVLVPKWKYAVRNKETKEIQFALPEIQERYRYRILSLFYQWVRLNRKDELVFREKGKIVRKFPMPESKKYPEGPIYNPKTVKFFKASEWDPHKSKMWQRTENGRVCVPLWVNKEYWNILKSGRTLDILEPGGIGYDPSIEICEVILDRQYA